MMSKTDLKPGGSILLLALVLGALAWVPAWAGPLEDLEAGKKALAERRSGPALELLQRAVRSKALPDFKLAEAHFFLGRIYERRGYSGQAEKHYSWAVTFDRSQGVYLDSLKRMRRATKPGGP
jgi:hypothetical protein